MAVMMFETEVNYKNIILSVLEFTINSQENNKRPHKLFNVSDPSVQLSKEG